MQTCTWFSLENKEMATWLYYQKLYPNSLVEEYKKIMQGF